MNLATHKFQHWPSIRIDGTNGERFSYETSSAIFDVDIVHGQKCYKKNCVPIANPEKIHIEIEKHFGLTDNAGDFPTFDYYNEIIKNNRP